MIYAVDAENCVCAKYGYFRVEHQTKLQPSDHKNALNARSNPF